MPPRKATCNNNIISQHLFETRTNPCHLFPPTATFFFRCLCSDGGVYGLWMLPVSLEGVVVEEVVEGVRRRAAEHRWDAGPHVWLASLLTQLLSRWNDLIPGLMNRSAHTSQANTHTHTQESVQRHTSHVCLFILHLIKRRSDAA